AGGSAVHRCGDAGRDQRPGAGRKSESAETRHQGAADLGLCAGYADCQRPTAIRHAGAEQALSQGRARAAPARDPRRSGAALAQAARRAAAQRELAVAAPVASVPTAGGDASSDCRADNASCTVWLRVARLNGLASVRLAPNLAASARKSTLPV